MLMKYLFYSIEVNNLRFRLDRCYCDCVGNADWEMGKPGRVAGNAGHGPKRRRGGALCWRED